MTPADDAWTPDNLRTTVGNPSQLVLDKQLDHLDVHARAFIALSPFCVLATSSSSGAPDASPRGDPPGFVKVLDDHRLVVPDRRGNRRVDSMRNIVDNGQVGLLFLIPGTNESLRVNGRATLTEDVALLSPCTVAGQQPILGILVAVEEVFLHCARALLRSNLWSNETWPNRSALPTLGQILHDQIGEGAMSVEALDELLDEANHSLY